MSEPNSQTEEQFTRTEKREIKQDRKSGRERRAYIILVLISIGLSVGVLLFGVHSVNASNHKWCTLITMINVPVPKPADPKVHPSRQRAYEFYLTIHQLSGDLGCRQKQG